MENLPQTFSEPFLGRMIGMIGRAMSKSLTERIRQEGYDLTMEEWVVLVHLWHQDGQNQAQLGAVAGRHKTAVTRAIDHLEELNFVVRVPDQNDRRNKLIYLTRAGKEMKTTLMPLAVQTEREALSGILPADLMRCRGVLEKILSNIRHHI